MRKEPVMRILRCDKHTARKNYVYYNGSIVCGDIYYRGFAINETGLPFEFMFTDTKIYDNRKVPYKILETELAIYYNNRKQYNL